MERDPFHPGMLNLSDMSAPFFARLATTRLQQTSVDDHLGALSLMGQLWTQIMSPELPYLLLYVRLSLLFFSTTFLPNLTCSSQLPLACRLAAFLLAAPFALFIALDLIAYGKLSSYGMSFRIG